MSPVFRTFLRHTWPWLVAAVCLAMYARANQQAGRAEMQAHVADSVAADAAKQRAAVLKSNAELAERVETEERRARIADSVAQMIAAREAGVRKQRDSARVALREAKTAADSIAALLAKSAADDSIIAEQERVIAQREREAAALRESNALLHSAVDSATAQLRRDAAVETQLRAALKAARPSTLRVWTERLVSGTVGYTIGKLTP